MLSNNAPMVKPNRNTDKNSPTQYHIGKMASSLPIASAPCKCKVLGGHRHSHGFTRRSPKPLRLDRIDLFDVAPVGAHLDIDDARHLELDGELHDVRSEARLFVL